MAEDPALLRDMRSARPTGVPVSMTLREIVLSVSAEDRHDPCLWT